MIIARQRAARRRTALATACRRALKRISARFLYCTTSHLSCALAKRHHCPGFHTTAGAACALIRGDNEQTTSPRAWKASRQSVWWCAHARALRISTFLPAPYAHSAPPPTTARTRPSTHHVSCTACHHSLAPPSPSYLFLTMLLTSINMYTYIHTVHAHAHVLSFCSHSLFLTSYILL